MLFWYLVALSLMALFTSILHFNSIYGMMFSGLITSLLLMFYARWRIFPLVFFNAIIIGGIFWLFYIVLFIPLFPGVITAWWNLKAISGVMLWGVPLEEPLAAVFSAMMLGPVLRLCSTSIREKEMRLNNAGDLLRKSMQLSKIKQNVNRATNI